MNKPFFENKYEEPSFVINDTSSINNFNIRYNELKKVGKTRAIVELLDQFFMAYPLQMKRLKEIYTENMSVYGNSYLAHQAARVYAEAHEKLAANGKKNYNSPLLVSDNGEAIGRLGELVDQSALTYLLKKLGKIGEKPLLVIDTERPLGNEGFRPYLEDCFELVHKKLHNDYFEKTQRSCPYSSFIYKFSDTQYGHNNKFFIDCHTELISNGLTSHPFTLKDVTIERAMKFLKNYGLKPDDEFVVLHLREQGFFDGFQHENRNALPENYYEAVEYFLKNGLKVIRIGNSKMTPMFERTGFVDLTRIKRPQEVDIFLCARAQFYFGSGSGPASVALTFGVPTVETARLDMSGLRVNHFVDYLIFEDIKTGKKMTFSDNIRMNLRGIEAPKPLADRGFIPKFPSANANLQFAKEALEYIDRAKIYKLNDSLSKKKETFNLWGGLSSNSLQLLN